MLAGIAALNAPLCQERQHIRSRPEGRPSARGGDSRVPPSSQKVRPLPPRHGVPGAVAVPGRETRVHHAAALQTMAHRRVPAPVVHVLAGGAQA
jgi:hypothetical protein